MTIAGCAQGRYESNSRTGASLLLSSVLFAPAFLVLSPLFALYLRGYFRESRNISTKVFYVAIVGGLFSTSPMAGCPARPWFLISLAYYQDRSDSSGHAPIVNVRFDPGADADWPPMLTHCSSAALARGAQTLRLMTCQVSVSTSSHAWSRYPMSQFKA